MSTRIVVGIDGSPHSDEALRWAIGAAERMAGAADATVVAVFAWEMPLIGIPGAFDPQEMETEAKAYLNRAVDAVAPDPPVRLERVVAHGDPTESLVEASRGADMLVVGTRGRSPFKGLLLGAISQGCAAAADCPVVIVKLRPAAVDGASPKGAGQASA